MLAIARGLMSNPKVLVLDEPSLGLAPLIVNEVIEYIDEINKQGVTILLVEQNARKAWDKDIYSAWKRQGSNAENLKAVIDCKVSV